MKKQMMLIKMLSMVLCVSLCFGLSVFAAAASPTEAKDSVVYIENMDELGNISAGSGFAIGKPGKPIQYIVTNCHVVESRDETGRLLQNKITVYFSAAANRTMQAEVYQINKSKDIAVLKLPEPTTERKALVLCPKDSLDLDDSFAALGYPYTAMTSDFPKMDTSDISVTRGGISKEVRIAGRECFLLDIEITHGNSGGPLVNSKGEVVGINTFDLTFQSGEVANYAIAIDELIRMISKDEIPYVVSKDVVSGHVLVIGAIAIAGVAVVVLVVLLKSKKTQTEPEPEPISDPTPIPDPPTPPSGCELVNISQGSAYGRRYIVSSSAVIGRNPNSCSILFPSDTPGVSSTHCKVTKMKNGLVLEDLHSTYGTFMQDGRQVLPGQVQNLRCGDRFYLGGQQNGFEVK